MKKKFYKKCAAQTVGGKTKKSADEKGSALVITLLIMFLLLAFVALAVTRTTNETVASSNDAAETRAFEAAHASLEVMTRNFNKIFETKLNADENDLTRIRGQNPPGFEGDYLFNQEIDAVPGGRRQVVMTGSLYQGLTASRDEWVINTAATDRTNGVQVALRRRFYNNRIPIFQFGIFYDDDLEFHPGPRFDFGGRVHSNSNLFLMANTGLYFNSKVTATREVFTNVARNGSPWTNWNDNVFIKNASGNYVKLANNMGSVLTSPANGNAVFSSNPDMPTVYKNSNWKSNEDLFQGNLLSNQNELNLPIRIASENGGIPLDYIELIKRGRNIGDLYNSLSGTPINPGIVPVTGASADSDITSSERYYNKSGIRITLADSKAKLPGCASGVGTVAVTARCGIRLDGAAAPGDNGSEPLSGQARGYQPLAMSGGYLGTELNGERFYMNTPVGRQMWIKVEAVGPNPTTNIFEVRDITEDFLSLGITEPAPTITVSGVTRFAIDGYGLKDSRSIIKLQRFMFDSPTSGIPHSASYITNRNWGSGREYNFVTAAEIPSTRTCASVAASEITNANAGTFMDFTSVAAANRGHWKLTISDPDISNRKRCVVPFPIKMFDTREGLYFENASSFNPTSSTNYGTNVPWNGVMSLIDIDIANLRRFLNGEWNGQFPTTTKFAGEFSPARGLRSTDIPNSNGWVLYVSDRRGDFDFDGEYDMEDIYGNNDGIMQAGEDINNDTALQADYVNEAPRYFNDGLATTSLWRSFVSPDVAAVFDHKFYRRGVRLINGEILPGVYDSINPANTRGFTVASENGVYVRGNYNAYGIASVGTPTPSQDYLPQNTANHIPASIAADAVTILSNGWSDGRSFRFPFTLSSRPATETFVRFAMLSGDARSSLNNTPNQGGGDPRLTGGVHNFKRFLERWDGGVRLNYAGSIINLYNARNNNGAFKCCTYVYGAPTRNWVFDSTFLNPDRLPPGTPFFQIIQLTGFQRLN